MRYRRALTIAGSDSGGGAGLPLEPLAGVPIAGEPLRQELEGHLAVQLRVLGEVHLAHPALAELLEYRVV